MSQGTLFAGQSIRGFLARGLIKHYNLDIEVTDKNDAYNANFPLNKIPAFIGPKGYKLTEVIAIVLYSEYLVVFFFFLFQELGIANCSDEPYYQFLKQLSLS